MAIAVAEWSITMNIKPLVIGDLTAKIPVIQGGMGVGISLSGLAGAVQVDTGFYGRLYIVFISACGHHNIDADNSVSCKLPRFGDLCFDRL